MGLFDQKSKFKVEQTVRRVKVEPKPAPIKKSASQSSRNSAPPTIRSTPPTISRTASRSNLGGHDRERSLTTSESPRESKSPPNRAVPVAKNRQHLTVPVRSSSHSSAGSVGERKRKLFQTSTARASPASDRVSFGNDSDSDSDDDNWERLLGDKKRQRPSHCDPGRQLAHPVLLETLPQTDAEKETKEKGTKEKETKENEAKEKGDDKSKDDRSRPARKDDYKLKLIHAKDVASLALKCRPVLGAAKDEVAVELQYPGSRHRESYELVEGKDKIDAVKDIKATISHIAHFYLTPEQAEPFTNTTTGIKRQLDRASSDSIRDSAMFKAAVKEFNRIVYRLHKDGSLARNLESKHGLPSDLVAFILQQVYDRTVAPNVELLRKYQNGSDNVYGELLHPFITNILVERLHMTSDQVFVDLGSGVGNVVLQAALEIGCESWGVEMMENACNLAVEQKKEFSARCRLWGVKPGPVHLERGDFREVRSNAQVMDALKRADVVLVNNQAFTSGLNDFLVHMFLDFKPGCKIVSLKSFVHDHKSASYNNDVGSSILDVETLSYPEEYVSWTGAAGTFCISTRK